MRFIEEINVAVVSIEADSTGKRPGFVFCINTSSRYGQPSGDCARSGYPGQTDRPQRNVPGTPFPPPPSAGAGRSPPFPTAEVENTAFVTTAATRVRTCFHLQICPILLLLPADYEPSTQPTSPLPTSNFLGIFAFRGITAQSGPPVKRVACSRPIRA